MNGLSELSLRQLYEILNFFFVESALLLAIRLDHWFHKNLNYDARSFFLAATSDILKFTKSS